MTPYYQDDAVTIYHGDCAEVMPSLAPESVDFVLTDPPYPAEFDACWSVLGAGASRLMRDGAPLFTYCGHYQLPKVLNDVGAFGSPEIDGATDSGAPSLSAHVSLVEEEEG